MLLRRRVFYCAVDNGHDHQLESSFATEQSLELHIFLGVTFFKEFLFYRGFLKNVRPVAKGWHGVAMLPVEQEGTSFATLRTLSLNLLNGLLCRFH